MRWLLALLSGLACLTQLGAGHARDEASPSSSTYLCRACGAPLFDAESHVHVSPSAQEAYGLKLASLEDAHDTDHPRHVYDKWVQPHASGRFVMFDAATNVVLEDAPSSTRLLKDFQQRGVSCSACKKFVGWRFERDENSAGGSSSGSSSSGGGKYKKARKAGAAAPAASTKASQHAAHASPSSSSSSAAASAEPVVGSGGGLRWAVREHNPATEDTVLAPLLEECVSSPRGWWTYEVCHKSRVRQFHFDAGNPNAVSNQDWSLGSFDASSRIERAVPLDPATTGFYASFWYRGGQHCDETGKGRSTEVQVFCCPYVKHSAPFIEAVEEPALCKYRMKVCAPSACMRVDENGAEIVATPPPAPSAAAEAGKEEGGEAAAATGASSGTPSALQPVDELPSSFFLAVTSLVIGDEAGPLASILNPQSPPAGEAAVDGAAEAALEAAGWTAQEVEFYTSFHVASGSSAAVMASM